MISHHFPDRFFFNGDDGGIYYASQVDRTNHLWWFAEHRDLQWSHVFRGNLVFSRGIEDRWDGEFVDVPKGLSCNHGVLNVGGRLHTAGLATLSQLAPAGISGLRNGGPASRDPVPGVLPPGIPKSPGFIGDGLSNLTGTWQGNDDGIYYLREVSSTGRIAWVGEHPGSHPTSSTHPGRNWVNVFMGQREKDLIRGDWADVPKGEVFNEGRMELRVLSATHLRILTETGGFGGLEFRRLDDIQLELRWVSMEIVDQQEWFFEADEPYFMALMIKMDGTTVNLVDPRSSTADVQGYVAPMLGDNVGAGTVIDLRRLPAFRTGIAPIPGADAVSDRPIFGVAVRGWEKDFSNQAWVTDRLADWRRNAAERLNRTLRSSGAVDLRRDAAVWHEVFSWANEDDNFGFDSSVISMADILRMGAAGTARDLVFQLRGADVHYRLRARLSVSGARGRCAP